MLDIYCNKILKIIGHKRKYILDKYSYNVIKKNRNKLIHVNYNKIKSDKDLQKCIENYDLQIKTKIDMKDYDDSNMLFSNKIKILKISINRGYPNEEYNFKNIFHIPENLEDLIIEDSLVLHNNIFNFEILKIDRFPDSLVSVTLPKTYIENLMGINAPLIDFHNAFPKGISQLTITGCENCLIMQSQLLPNLNSLQELYLECGAMVIDNLPDSIKTIKLYKPYYLQHIIRLPENLEEFIISTIEFRFYYNTKLIENYLERNNINFKKTFKRYKREIIFYLEKE